MCIIHIPPQCVLNSVLKDLPPTNTPPQTDTPQTNSLRPLPPGCTPHKPPAP
ncbi:hypothetical protein LINPERHAP1_LOCUS3929 [Linum perenne]